MLSRVLLLTSGVAVLASSLLAPSKPQSKGTVMLFLSTDCPKAMQYTPRINALHERFGAQGFQWEAYFPNDLESRELVAQYGLERGYRFPLKLDLGAQTAKRFGVTHTPQVVVVNVDGKVVYSGAIDDNADASLTRKPYLADALEAVLEGKAPSLKKTQPVGCELMPSEAPPATTAVTFSEHVAPILYKNCVECHRPGEVAPFSLDSYTQAKKWAKNIANVTQSRRMPPWKAVHGFGEFEGALILSESDLETLKRWAEAGAPRGDAKKEPKPPTFPVGWRMGPPDMIVQNSKPFQLEADGADVYRNFVIKTDFKEPRYVTAMDVKPGNPKVVHHVIAFVDVSGRAQQLEAKQNDGQEGYNTFGGPGFNPDTSFGGWAPGNRSAPTPEGTGFLLKPGATIVMQVHYHKSGKPETDQTKLGLYFSKVPVKKEMKLAWLANVFLKIPANEPAHTVKFGFTLPANATIYGVMPHMHYLGRSMKAELAYKDGRREPLIHVADWDFRWQLGYQFKRPIQVPKGTRVEAVAVYDNSENNPNQPNHPPKEVRWGEETTDEMMLLVVPYTVD